MAYDTQSFLEKHLFTDEHSKKTVLAFAERIQQGISHKTTHPTIRETIKFGEEGLNGDKHYYINFKKLLDYLFFKPDVYMAVLLYVTGKVMDKKETYFEALLERLGVKQESSMFAAFLAMLPEDFKYYQHLYSRFFIVCCLKDEDYLKKDDRYQLSDQEYSWLQHDWHLFCVNTVSTESQMKGKEKQSKKSSNKEFEIEQYKNLLKTVCALITTGFFSKIHLSKLSNHFIQPNPTVSLNQYVIGLVGFCYQVVDDLKKSIPNEMPLADWSNILQSEIKSPLLLMIIAYRNVVLLQHISWQNLITMINEHYHFYETLPDDVIFLYNGILIIRQYLESEGKTLSKSEIVDAISHNALPVIINQIATIEDFPEALLESSLKKFSHFCRYKRPHLTTVNNGAINYINDVFSLAILFLIISKRLGHKHLETIKEIIIEFKKDIEIPRYANLVSMIFELFLSMLEAEQIRQRAQQAEQKCIDLQEELNRTTAENKALKTENSQLKQQVKNQEREKKTLESKARKLEEDRKNQDELSKKLSEERKEIAEERKHFVAIRATLDKKIEELSTALNESNNKCQELEKELKKSKEETASLKKEKQESSTSYQEAKKNLQKEIQELNNSHIINITTLENKLQEAIARNNTAQKELKKLTSTTATLEYERKKTEQDKGKLQLELDKIKAEFSRMEAVKLVTEQNLASLLVKINSLAEQYDSAAKNSQEMERKYFELIAQLQEKYNTLEISFGTLQLENSILQDSMADAREKIQELTQKLPNMREAKQASQNNISVFGPTFFTNHSSHASKIGDLDFSSLHFNPPTK